MAAVSDDFQSEIVVAFVGPVGVDSSRFHSLACTRLRAFRYTPTLIRLSECIDEFKAEGFLKTELHAAPEYERILSHMRAGDELRGLADNMGLRGGDDGRGLLAHAVVSKIGNKRPKSRSDPNQTLPMRGHAWLLSSLKNPSEVKVLRSIYRAGFFLIGLFATEAERKRALQLRGMSADEASHLLREDIEGEKKSGQQTRKTFELADAWVQTEDELCRVLDLIFGNTFHTPTDDENAMALAYTEALRSSDLSRQVGAVIVAPTGEIIATGRNEAPAPGGGQYSPPSRHRPTARDCDIGEDYNQKERLKIQAELGSELERLVHERIGPRLDEENQVLLSEVTQIATEVLERSRLHDITEFGRAVHGELSAILSATRTGSTIRGATLFCTTFPCHNCAKHIVAAGIARVVFVEPYPKSKAIGLHADAIKLVGEDIDAPQLSDLTAKLRKSRTVFTPFIGVGPRRYFDLFSMRLGQGRDAQRKHDKTGRKIDFSVAGATPRVQLAPTNYLQREIESANTLLEAMNTLTEKAMQ